MKELRFAVISALSSVCAFAEAVVPSVTEVSIAQDRSRKVTIAYRLSNGPAVVTFDIQTNCVVAGETRWISIGGNNIDCYSGNGNCPVTEDGMHRIYWHPDKSWPAMQIAAGGVRAVVTAWATDNTPDYMVVDLAEHSDCRVRYYTSTNDLPGGGLLGNEAYRTSKLVMRRIHAKNVSWTMGSYFEPGRIESTEMTHQVTLTNDYYIGVFEVTQAQWAMIKGTGVSAKITHPGTRLIRPMEGISYSMIRLGADNVENLSAWYPNPPGTGSFLAELRGRTELDFDLPSEAQWEFAARAGQGEGKYGDGSPYALYRSVLPEGVTVPGRYKYTQADPATSLTGGGDIEPENATAICGSYAPNNWGLYDMHGNVYELCLDWYRDDITALGGAVNVAAGGTNGSGARLVVRKGGNWNQGETFYLRAASRIDEPTTACVAYDGFRVVCTAGLK